MNRKPFSSNVGSNTRQVVEELSTTPHMPDWYVYQPPLAFKPMGILVWGGDTVYSFRIGLEEQLVNPCPAAAFTTRYSLEELKKRAEMGILIPMENAVELAFPSMSPATRINMRVTGLPKTVAVYGIQLVED